MTMLFLPATFFAALFAMPLFQWDTSPVIRDRFWIYCAWTLPTTIAIFAVFFSLEHRTQIRRTAQELRVRAKVGNADAEVVLSEETTSTMQRTHEEVENGGRLGVTPISSRVNQQKQAAPIQDRIKQIFRPRPAAKDPENDPIQLHALGTNAEASNTEGSHGSTFPSPGRLSGLSVSLLQGTPVRPYARAGTTRPPLISRPHGHM